MTKLTDKEDAALTPAATIQADIEQGRRDAEPKKVRTLAITTQPTAKKIQPRAAEIPYGSRVDRHYNNDGSVTLYARGLKIFRTASDQDVEDGLVSEDYDADEAIEKFLNKWFGKGKQWVFGRTTRGARWKKRTAAPVAADEAK